MTTLCTLHISIKGENNAFTDGEVWLVMLIIYDNSPLERLFWCTKARPSKRQSHSICFESVDQEDDILFDYSSLDSSISL